MGRFIPVKYGRCSYPQGITPRLAEIAANFDARPVIYDVPFSLHTEFSFAHRNFTNPAVDGLDVLRFSHRASIPCLWASEKWAEEFARFVVADCNGHIPSVVEVHPPFDDYATLESFLERYAVFERVLLNHYPEVTPLIENRSGTLYRGGRFVLSTAEQLIHFSELLDKSSVSLKITLDIPQLFTAHGAKTKDIAPLLESMRSIRHNISGIHIWGKRENAKGRRIAHVGDLNDYFFGKQRSKALFLSELSCLLDDEIPRYLVPEVNSGQADFTSIIGDLIASGFMFC